MLERLTNTEIIEHTTENPDASEVELELAERLMAAIDELDRLSNTVRALEAHAELSRVEADDGADA